VRAERHPNADLSRTPAYGVRHHAVQAHGLSKWMTNTLFITAGRFRRIDDLLLAMNSQPFLGIEFDDQFLWRSQTIGSHQDRFDFCPVALRRIEPQPYPA
jgi:hypothetical protein